jgi:hypothetical protein
MTETEKAIRDFCGHHADWWPSTTQVQEMLALAQPEQEPVLWAMPDGKIADKWALQFYGGQKGKPLYTTPPQRKPLSDEEIYSLADSLEIWNEDDEEWILDPNTFARAIEAAHGIKEST